MARLAPYVIGGLLAALPFQFLPLAMESAVDYAGPAVSAPAPVSNAARKGDRLRRSVAAAAVEHIATIEVVGLREPAIVYRARDGRELFRTDPVSNVTVISKGLRLPEVTVRERTGSAVKPLPVQTLPAPVPSEQANDRKAPVKRRILLGCEPLYSPLTALPNQAGRCMSEVAGSVRVAAAQR